MTDSTIMKSLNGYEICDAVARGMSPIAASSTDGKKYTATINGITELKPGMSFIIIPNKSNAIQVPTLNVNNLGEVSIRMQVSAATSATRGGESGETWFVKDVPVRVTYRNIDGNGNTLHMWVTDLTTLDLDTSYGVLSPDKGGTGCTSITDLKTAIGFVGDSGIVPITMGGTGASNITSALNNLGITWGTAEAPSTGTPFSIYIQML